MVAPGFAKNRLMAVASNLPAFKGFESYSLTCTTHFFYQGKYAKE